MPTTVGHPFIVLTQNDNGDLVLMLPKDFAAKGAKLAFHYEWLFFDMNPTTGIASLPNTDTNVPFNMLGRIESVEIAESKSTTDKRYTINVSFLMRKDQDVKAPKQEPVTFHLKLTLFYGANTTIQQDIIQLRGGEANTTDELENPRWAIFEGINRRAPRNTNSQTLPYYNLGLTSKIHMHIDQSYFVHLEEICQASEVGTRTRAAAPPPPSNITANFFNVGGVSDHESEVEIIEDHGW